MSECLECLGGRAFVLLSFVGGSTCIHNMADSILTPKINLWSDWQCLHHFSSKNNIILTMNILLITEKINFLNSWRPQTHLLMVFNSIRNMPASIFLTPIISFWSDWWCIGYIHFEYVISHWKIIFLNS